MRKALQVGLVSAGILLIGSSAQAAENWTSSGNLGILNGNQVYLPIQAPINICGNAVGVLGTASAGCVGGASAVHYDSPNRAHYNKTKSKSARHGAAHGICDLNWSTTGNVGLLNGNQVYAPIQMPVDISGNAVGVLGTANAWSTGGSSATHC